jgi:hypothetical protein
MTLESKSTINKKKFDDSHIVSFKFPEIDLNTPFRQQESSIVIIILLAINS